MRWRIVAVGVIVTTACGHAGPPPPAPATARAGCLALGPEAMAPPFLLPDTIELAAEWFLPDDSTGGRLRVVRPRDASLGTYRTYGGRFWWESAGDSVLVTRSDGTSGTVLSLAGAGEVLTGEVRAFGPAARGGPRPAAARRIPCDVPSR